ncbi:hypothetical protein ACOME3_009468 [Neoechinorhynchus agilis]
MPFKINIHLPMTFSLTLIMLGLLPDLIECRTTDVVMSSIGVNRCNTQGAIMSIKALSIKSNLPRNVSCQFQVNALSSKAEGFIFVILRLPVKMEQLFVYDMRSRQNISINERTKDVCLLLGPTLIMYYINDNPTLSSKLDVVISQYLCQGNTLCYLGCKTTECTTVGIQQLCHKSCISSDMRCDGFMNCPFQEDEMSCVISSLSRIAFVGTIALFIILMITGVSYMILRRFRGSRRERLRRMRQGDEMTAPMDVIAGQSPPSYNEIERGPASGIQSYYAVQRLDELPKYNQVEMSAVYNTNEGLPNQSPANYDENSSPQATERVEDNQKQISDL